MTDSIMNNRISIPFLALVLIQGLHSIEINGIGHAVWAIYERAYVTGVATAPVLLILAVYLSRLVLSLRK